MKNISILWVDDEIDLLKPHILFLQGKNYQVFTANNGTDAIEMVRKQYFDVILLDENMPGINGLQALAKIKDLRPDIPVIMITKSEEEFIMDKAIGSKISDYLIKPVNPNQILLSIKKNTEHKRLITEKTNLDYQSEFRNIAMQIGDNLDSNGWIDIYKKLVHWELQLADSGDHTMDEVLKMQKNEANKAFSKYVKKNYTEWFSGKAADKPLLSPSLFKSKVYPWLSKNQKTVFLVIDNLRFDQWRTLLPNLLQFYTLDEDNLYYGILPSATQYARNSIFSGLMPSEIEKLYPELWVNEEEEGGKNLYEEQLLQKQLSRLGYHEKFYFEKVLNSRAGKKVLENIAQINNYQLSVIVINFVDMMSHARTEVEMIRELASDEPSYRSITLSWFEHSSLFDMLKALAQQNIKLIVSTDHGAIRVHNPVKVIGDRNTNTNLRFKVGKNLNYNPKEVFAVTDPQKAFLPRNSMTSSYIFTCNDDFFAYPNNYNHYVNYYTETFQHGGISMEEMLIPVATLTPKK